MENPEPWRNAVALTSRWRLVTGRELYDIKADPGQSTDVAPKHPEVVRQLREQYDRGGGCLRPAFQLGAAAIGSEANRSLG